MLVVKAGQGPLKLNFDKVFPINIILARFHSDQCVEQGANVFSPWRIDSRYCSIGQQDLRMEISNDEYQCIVLKDEWVKMDCVEITRDTLLLVRKLLLIGAAGQNQLVRVCIHLCNLK